MGPEPTVEYQTQALKAQAEQLENSLDQIRKRIAELDSAKAKES